MQELEPKISFNSFRIRILILILLLVIIAILTYLKIKYPSAGNSSSAFNYGSNNNHTLDINYNYLKSKFEIDIDSIISSYKIKKEWCITMHSGDKPLKIKDDKSTYDSKDAQWFTKYVTIPKDLVSADLNLEISSYLNTAGLKTSVDENIKTADINISVYPPNDTLQNAVPYFKLIIKHSDKVQRETSNIVIILNDNWEYKPEDIDRMISSYSEFSFIFPRNPEQIDFQNKLLQAKKDLIINLTVGDKDKPDYDFFTSMDEKELKQKIKNITTESPFVKNVLITGNDASPEKVKLFQVISEEFLKYGVKCIPDSSITKLNQKDEDKKNRVNVIINTLKSKLPSKNSVIAIVSLNFDEFNSFYNEIYSFKKAGYRFYSLSQYLSKEEEKKKKELEKPEKTKPDTKEKPENKKTTEKKDKSEKKRKQLKKR